MARSLASSVYLGSPTVLGGLSITCCGYCFAKECCIGEYVSEALTSAEIISHRCVLLCNVVLSDYAAIGGVSVRKLLPAPLARYAALSKEPIALVVMRKPTQPFTTQYERQRAIRISAECRSEALGGIHNLHNPHDNYDRSSPRGWNTHKQGLPFCWARVVKAMVELDDGRSMGAGPTGARRVSKGVSFRLIHKRINLNLYTVQQEGSAMVHHILGPSLPRNATEIST